MIDSHWQEGMIHEWNHSNQELSDYALIYGSLHGKIYLEKPTYEKNIYCKALPWPTKKL